MQELSEKILIHVQINLVCYDCYVVLNLWRSTLLYLKTRNEMLPECMIGSRINFKIMMKIH